MSMDVYYIAFNVYEGDQDCGTGTTFLPMSGPPRNVYEVEQLSFDVTRQLAANGSIAPHRRVLVLSWQKLGA